METIKRQKAKVGVAGSFFNQLMSNNSSIPEVGKGATQMHYSDRSCYEVLEVSKDGKTVKLEALDARWDKTKQGGEGHQNWILEPSGRFTIVQWRHNAWRVKSQKILFTDEHSRYACGGDKFSKENYEKFIKPCFDKNGNLILIEGKTELKTEWHKINIMFGTKEYYYDWSF